MTKEEIITKWEKELHRIDLEIFAAKQYQTYLSNKITVRRKVILSMLEDLKKLTLPQVSNNEVAVCDFCDKPMTNKTLRTCDEHAINRRM